MLHEEEPLKAGKLSNREMYERRKKIMKRRGEDGGSRRRGTQLDSTVTSGNKFLIENKDGDVSPVKYSFVRVVKTNNHIEVHEAEFPFILDRPISNAGTAPSKNKNNIRNPEYRYRNARKAMNTIRRLSVGNFRLDEMKHLTLTFMDDLDFDIRDITVCNKKFTKFAKKLRRKYNSFKYVKVAEFQDKNNRGAVHYHVMCNLPFVDPEKVERLWGYGFIKIRKPPYDIAKYLFKYLIKNSGDKRFNNKRSWSHSNNLETPKIYYQQMANSARHDLAERNLSPNFSYSYDSNFNGMIHVYEYDLNNPIPRSPAQPINPILPKKDGNDRK